MCITPIKLAGVCFTPGYEVAAVEEGFQADLLDAVELVQGLVLDEGSGKGKQRRLIYRGQ